MRSGAQWRLLGRTPRDSWLRILAFTAGLAVVAVAALLLHNAQAKSRAQLEARHQDRVGLSATFVQSYIDGVMDRESAAARRTLESGDGRALQAALTDLGLDFGFSAAVLLDGQGRVLASVPPDASLLGQRISDRYAHLQAAVAGSRAVSGVVPSAVTGAPVAAFAVPFDGPGGRRVLSGAYEIKDTPLAPFLRNASLLSGSESYLVDESSHIVAAATRTPAGVITIARVDPALPRALTHGRRGFYAGKSRFFAVAPVQGTPWTLVTTAPTRSLLAPVQGASRLVPWLLIVLLGLALLVAVPLGTGLIESRRRLRISHQQLQHIASLDELTGLFNRRYVREQLSAHLAGSRRHGYPVSVAVLDLDHFKRINDTFGHSAGDTVLSDVARAMAAQLRAEDVLCRWGGEEFLLLLPHLDPDGAERAADRMRAAVEQLAIPVGTGGDIIHVTLSAGVSTNRPDEHPDALIHRADLALYVAKTSGRNRVRRAEFGIRPSDPIVS
jgi:diguanylate cyclase (GGDEF)-like protein